MIQRFEDEYPETKLLSTSPPTANGMPSPSILSISNGSNGAEYFGSPPARKDDHALKLLRTPSGTSVAAKAYTEEEGRMHRFGQTMRREVLKSTGIEDNLHGTSENSTDPPHLAALRSKLEELNGEDIRLRVERDGADNVIRELGLNAQELLMLREQDPQGFEAFRESQLAAHINAGLMSSQTTM